ncbi:MAG: hypothetical protein HYT89_03790 [Candidatus Omnitrophica bacterium]|nr:hypothetical protein [Candidatus Omnitrophota bacterium]
MERPQELAKDIVLIDGLSGSGKSLLCPVLSTMERGELWLADHVFEYLSAMESFGRISRDAAGVLVRLFADFDLYNLFISRYTNFRETDQTGARLNLLHKRQIKRLKMQDGNVVMERIRNEKPVLLLMTHYILDESDVLFDALGDRLKLYIVTVRHPAHLVEFWHNACWPDRVGVQPREFQLSARWKGKIVPWYAVRWADQYLALKSPLEKSVWAVTYFFRRFEQKVAFMPARRKEKVLFIPFEEFSTDPEKHLSRVAKRTGMRVGPLARKMMKKLKLPRENPKESIEAQKKKIRQWMEDDKAPSRTRVMLEELINRYEEKY